MLDGVDEVVVVVDGVEVVEVEVDEVVDGCEVVAVVVVLELGVEVDVESEVVSVSSEVSGKVFPSSVSALTSAELSVVFEAI